MKGVRAQRPVAYSHDWSRYAPKKRIGCLSPPPLVENGAYEFYHLAPKGVMTVFLAMGLARFEAKDVERIFRPLEKMVAMLKARKCDLIVQAGIPLPILMGVKAHGKLMRRIQRAAGGPVDSTIEAVTKAAAHLGIKHIAFANKWNASMNRRLEEFFARDGVKVAGVASQSMAMEKLPALTTEDGMELSYQLGKAAIEQNPKADGLYVGGGQWMCLPAVVRLEQEFGIPCICNHDTSLWHALRLMNYWKPIKGHNALLAGA